MAFRSVPHAPPVRPNQSDLAPRRTLTEPSATGSSGLGRSNAELVDDPGPEHRLHRGRVHVTLGFGIGIMASVVTNNVAVLAALGNGVLPLRKVAQIEAERRRRLELTQSRALERASTHSSSETPNRTADRQGEQRRVVAAST